MTARKSFNFTQT